MAQSHSKIFSIFQFVQKHLVVFFVLLFSTVVMAQNQTVGLLINQDQSSDGYTLIAKNGDTYLIDQAGMVVHTWANNTQTTHPGYLQENGDLILVSRGVRRLTWDGDQVWRYNNSAAHHDVAMLPNGNVLLLISGSKSSSEAVTAGRDPSLVTDEGLEPMVIYEVEPTGDVVWQWHVWDHLIQDLDATKDNFGDVAEHPELVDINFTRNTSVDWLHGNAINYNAELDQILLSPRFNNEIWIIDHSTTTAQAAEHTGGLAGKGGDLLFRWGHPIAYATGLDDDQQLFGSHDAQWIDDGLPGAGNILVFNNGGTHFSRDGDYSTIDELEPQLDGYNYGFTQSQTYAPNAPSWTYQSNPRENFYSSFISGVQRLSNGNTFINEGENGRVFEVTDTGEIVWQYQNPIINSGILTQGDEVPGAPQPSLFRAYKYPKDHPGLIGRELTPTGSIENYDSMGVVTVQSTSTGLVAYPGEGVFTYGVGQLMTLSASETSIDEFQNWAVINGAADFADSNAAKTTFTVQSVNTTIQAIYEKRDELIFKNGFDES